MGIVSLRSRGARQRTAHGEDTATAGASRRAPAGARTVLALAALAVFVPACATSPPGPVPEAAARVTALEEVLARTAEPPPPGAVRVRLAFGPTADLDLFVTDADPRSHETVYFAKHTTRSGGRLLRDARCEDAAPRTDIVVFDAIPAGGLRIGVDHHAGCGGRAQPEPFVVEVATAGRRETRSGIARPGHFEDAFWRWSVGDQYMPNVK